MIRTKLAYDGAEILINPYTVSYILRQESETIIGFTNGHTYPVTASLNELKEGIENETKSLCKGCSQSPKE